MKVLPTALLVVAAVYLQQTKAILECPCSTAENDASELLFDIESVNLTEAGQAPVLELSGDAFPFIEGDDGTVCAAVRSGCGKVVVCGSQEAFIGAGDDIKPLLSNTFKWLGSNGGKRVCVLSLGGNLRPIVEGALNNTCFTITDPPSRTELDDCDILILQTRTNLNNPTNNAVIDAVKGGKALFLITRLSNNVNELPEEFGITITETLTDVEYTVPPPELCDPSEAITTEVDFGKFEPGEIASIADNGFVPQEGIGASYYGTGRVLVVGNQALFQRGSTFRENTDFICEALSWVQDCNKNCSCEVGYMMRGTPFVRMSTYLKQIDKDVPAVEITPDEMCTTCCVGINLGVVRGDNVDAEAVQEYVYNGGCLILTCPNAATNIRPINDLLEPFGLEIPQRKG
jgi:hypothetical protein